MLAIQPIGKKKQLPIVLLRPERRPRSLRNRLTGSFLWSPSGETLAVFSTSPKGDALLELVTANAMRSYPITGAGRGPVRPVGWWPDGRGILYWLDPGGCDSCVVDGADLLDRDLVTGKVRHLGIAITYRDWIATSSDRLLVVKGGDRSAFFGKHLQLCLPGTACKTIPAARSRRISLDPAWSPTRDRMAFVVAPSWKTWGFRSGVRYRRWLRAHFLWTAKADGSGAAQRDRVVTKGAEDPQWTRDGRGILFVKDGALWLDPHLGRGKARLIGRMVSPGSLPDPGRSTYRGWYYGHMDWHDLFAWY